MFRDNERLRNSLIVNKQDEIKSIFNSIRNLPQLNIQTQDEESKKAMVNFISFLKRLENSLKYSCKYHQGNKAVKIAKLYENAIKLTLNPDSNDKDKSEAINKLTSCISRSKLPPAVGTIIVATLLAGAAAAPLICNLLSLAAIGGAAASPVLFGLQVALVILVTIAAALAGALIHMKTHNALGLDDLSDVMKGKILDAVKKTPEDFLNEEEERTEEEFTSNVTSMAI